jgi:hypothetical protein
MYRQASVILSAALMLGGCVTAQSNAPATVKAECSIFTDPGFIVRGKTKRDQSWVTETQEVGIESCGWKRPAPPPQPGQATMKPKRRWFGS